MVLALSKKIILGTSGLVDRKPSRLVAGATSDSSLAISGLWSLFPTGNDCGTASSPKWIGFLVKQASQLLPDPLLLDVRSLVTVMVSIRVCGPQDSTPIGSACWLMLFLSIEYD